jgi:hypothetical protein
MEILNSSYIYIALFLWLILALCMIRAFLKKTASGLTFAGAIVWLTILFGMVFVGAGITKLPAYIPKTQEKSYVPAANLREPKDIPFNPVPLSPSWEEIKASNRAENAKARADFENLP